MRRAGTGVSGRLAAVAAAALLGACSLQEGMPGVADEGAAAEAPAPAGAVATTPLGAYLSGRVAEEERDLPAALAFYEDALAHEPSNPELVARVFVLAVSEGRFDVAGPLARELVEADPQAGLANAVVAIEALKAGHAGRALAAARRLPDDGFNHELGGFTRAWSEAAEEPGAPAKAVAELATVDRNGAETVLRHLHTALIEDLAGNAAAAAPEYDAVIASGKPTLRLVELAGNFLERAGERDQAARLYAGYMADNPESGVTLAVSAATPAPLVPDAASGLAEALFDLASLVSQTDAAEVALLSLRMALELRPDFPLARVVLADLLEAGRRSEAALALYRSTDPASPYSWTARLRAAAVMDELGDHDGAAASLRAMAAERPAQALPLIALGDLEREQKQDAAAVDAYTGALARLGPQPARRYWSVYYGRGATYQHMGQWAPAEADLRHALAMAPDEPELLNFLGYSLVEHGSALAEAQGMLKRAVELRPDDGFIVDSLGWAYFRLGKYGEAQKTLERAVELRPEDAEINDHLGDAYWRGGKLEEARLQWHRALSLNPEPDLVKAIDVKLEHNRAPKRAPLYARPAK